MKSIYNIIERLSRSVYKTLESDLVVDLHFKEENSLREQIKPLLMYLRQSSDGV